MRRLIIMFVLAVAVTVIAGPAAAGGGGCHGFTEEPATEIVLEANCFGPTVSHVAVGDTVTWRNADSWAHNVYSTAFDGTPNLDWNDTYSLTFDKAGVFPYVCTLHPGMMGTLVVGDAVMSLKTVPAASPTTTVPPTTLPPTTVPPTTVPPTNAAAAGPEHLAGPSPVAAPELSSAVEGDTNHAASWLVGATILAAGALLGTGITRWGAR